MSTGPNRRQVGLGLASAALLGGCAQTRSGASVDPIQSGARPNILFLIAEDMSPRLGCYGDPLAQTPNLDRLAAQSIRFTNAFTTSGVCAPSRSAIITGVHQQTLGSQHMRTYTAPPKSNGWDYPYMAVPPAEVKAFPELMRRAGYYTCTNGKLDYQFGDPFTIWNDSKSGAHWRKRPDASQPFLAYLTLFGTHESWLWPSDLKLDEPRWQRRVERNAAFRSGHPPVTDRGAVEVPPYLPDTPEVRETLGQLYDNIHYMDAEVGRYLSELEEDGLLENTIIIFASDHGDGLPRAKRSIYDSGIHIPLLVRFPDGSRAGETDDQFVSGVDLAPTLLHLAGQPVPDWIQGSRIAFDGPPQRDAIFAARDRMINVEDRMKAVRTRQFKYIRNYRTDAPYFRPLGYRDVLPAMQALWDGLEAETLSPEAEQFFLAPRAPEELYDISADPHEINNLAGDPAYADILADHRRRLDDWLSQTPDLSAIPEEDLAADFWPNRTAPVTPAPKVYAIGHDLALMSMVLGASIGWRLAGSDDPWTVHGGITPPPLGKTIEAKAIRYGWAESPVVTLQVG